MWPTLANNQYSWAPPCSTGVRLKGKSKRRRKEDGEEKKDKVTRKGKKGGRI